MRKVDQNRARRRRGTVLPMLAFFMVTIVGFMALSMDLGMLSIAKTQTQQAADLAALTAARTLNGVVTTSYNQTGATTNARNILGYNKVLGQTVNSSQLSLTYGSYDYNQTSQTFSANYPGTSGQPATAVAATVNSVSIPSAFSNILGKQMIPSVSATAQAVHRPRDIALVIDFSSSMRLGTLLGYDFYTWPRTTNNSDPLVPTFGSYSSSSAVMQSPNSIRQSPSQYAIPPANFTTTTSTYSLTYINSFFQNAAFTTPLVRAFDSYTSTDGGSTWSAPASTAKPQIPPASYATTPGGDVPLKKLSSSSFAQTTSDVTGSSSLNVLWELDGYALFKSGVYDTSAGGFPAVWNDVDYSTNGLNFNGYTQGPGYYGKTFFVWPPDPRGGAVTTQSTVNTWLQALGMTAADASTLSGLWSTFQAQGQTTGTQSVYNWLNSRGYNSAIYVPNSGNKAKTINAVQRLFNRGYPNGSANGAYAADWRVRFFGTNDNTKLFNTSNGYMNLPGSSTYSINYNAILNWIAKTPCPFPTQMRAGHIKYYGSIPNAITGNWPNYGSTDQQFWANFIDYALGFWQTSAGVYTDISGVTGYGQDFTWGSNSINSPPAASTLMAMNYNDNPDRPLLRHWFGPILMTDWFNNDNISQNWVDATYLMTPGNAYEAPYYVGKQGFEAAISTMQTNHPNDWVTIVPYSNPRSGSWDTNYGRFNCVRSPLGTNYTYAANALVFPFSTLKADGTSNGTEVTPYGVDPSTGAVPSADFWDTPRAYGNTCFAMGLMLCYNQFAVTPTSDGTLRNFVSSSPIAFPPGMAGGLGRKGAQKVIIFETDGLANNTANANLINAGSYSYYQIRYDMNNPYNSEYPSQAGYGWNDPNVLNQIYSLIQQLSNTYGTTRNPFRLYSIGFGPIFTSPYASAASSTLQAMQYYAGTQSSPSTPLSSNQILTGTDTQISSAMTTTYSQILQKGVQVALIK